MTKVTATGRNSTSIHIFETYKEASNFVEWIMGYNADLELKIEEEKDEQDITYECPTFI